MPFLIFWKTYIETQSFRPYSSSCGLRLPCWTRNSCSRLKSHSYHVENSKASGFKASSKQYEDLKERWDLLQKLWRTYSPLGRVNSSRVSKLQLPKSPLVWFINSQGKNTLIRGQIKAFIQYSTKIVKANDDDRYLIWIRSRGCHDKDD